MIAAGFVAWPKASQRAHITKASIAIRVPYIDPSLRTHRSWGEASCHLPLAASPSLVHFWVPISRTVEFASLARFFLVKGVKAEKWRKVTQGFCPTVGAPGPGAASRAGLAGSGKNHNRALILGNGQTYGRGSAPPPPAFMADESAAAPSPGSSALRFRGRSATHNG